MKFTFSLHPEWETTVGGANPVFMRRGRTNQNALQFSMNENVTGKPMNPKPDVKEMAKGMARQIGGRPKSTSTQKGQKGQMGRAVFDKDDLAYCELWVATDNLHLAVATFCCDERPSAEELREVEKMVTSITWQ